MIRAAAYRPFEGGRRVFVIEAAEAMRDESQNALLKTLEEPPAFAHLILLSSEPEALLETIASRCQPVEFAPLPGGGGRGRAARRRRRRRDEVAAAARLAAGDLERARFLLSRRAAGSCARRRALRGAALAGESLGAPWRRPARRRPRRPARTPRRRPARRSRRRRRRASSAPPARSTDEAKRAGRRRRTEILDLGLALCASWFRDLAAVAAGAEEVVFNRDRLAQLRAAAPRASTRPPPAAAAELVQDTRRRLDLNVSEELALEALFFRLEREIDGGG